MVEPEDAKTPRQILRRELERRPSASITALSRTLGDHSITRSPEEVINEIEELSYSMELAVKPAYCKHCGFDDWGKLLNLPSQCPECRSEWISEPEVKEL